MKRGEMLEQFHAFHTVPVATPERYAAMMNAVAERNRRVAEMAKSPA